MNTDYIEFQRFTDTESAEEFVIELKNNNISYRFIDNNNATNVKVVGYTTIEIAIGVNIMEKDFEKASLILENYYDNQIKYIDKLYYLFDFTNDELHDIILNPFNWGRLDYQLAKHILKERGQTISEEEINNIKNNKIEQLSTIEKVSIFKIITGYVLAVFFPIISIFIGLTIKYNRIILPNGKKFYIHSKQDIKHGERIIIISIIFLCVFLFRLLLNK